MGSFIDDNWDQYALIFCDIWDVTQGIQDKSGDAAAVRYLKNFKNRVSRARADKSVRTRLSHHILISAVTYYNSNGWADATSYFRLVIDSINDVLSERNRRQMNQRQMNQRHPVDRDGKIPP